MQKENVEVNTTLRTHASAESCLIIIFREEWREHLVTTLETTSKRKKRKVCKMTLSLLCLGHLTLKKKTVVVDAGTSD